MYAFFHQPIVLVAGIALSLFSLFLRSIVGNLIVRDVQEKQNKWMGAASARSRAFMAGGPMGFEGPPDLTSGYSILYNGITYMMLYPGIILALGSLGVMIHASFSR